MSAVAAAVCKFIDQPFQVISALGGGDLKAGLAELNALSRAEAPYTNAYMCKGTDTVGADTLITMDMENFASFIPCGFLYSNDTSDTGYLTALKANDAVVLPAGFQATTPDNPLWTELLLLDGWDCLMTFPKKTKIRWEGVAVNGDVVDILFYGIRTTMKKVD